MELAKFKHKVINVQYKWAGNKTESDLNTTIKKLLELSRTENLASITTLYLGSLSLDCIKRYRLSDFENVVELKEKNLSQLALVTNSEGNSLEPPLLKCLLLRCHTLIIDGLHSGRKLLLSLLKELTDDVKELHLHHLTIDKETANEICHVIVKLKSLKILVIANCEFEDRGMQIQFYKKLKIAVNL